MHEQSDVTTSLLPITHLPDFEMAAVVPAAVVPVPAKSEPCLVVAVACHNFGLRPRHPIFASDHRTPPWAVVGAIDAAAGQRGRRLLLGMLLL